MSFLTISLRSGISIRILHSNDDIIFLSLRCVAKAGGTLTYRQLKSYIFNLSPFFIQGVDFEYEHIILKDRNDGRPHSYDVYITRDLFLHLLFLRTGLHSHGRIQYVLNSPDMIFLRRQSLASFSNIFQLSTVRSHTEPTLSSHLPNPFTNTAGEEPLSISPISKRRRVDSSPISLPSDEIFDPPPVSNVISHPIFSPPPPHLPIHHVRTISFGIPSNVYPMNVTPVTNPDIDESLSKLLHPHHAISLVEQYPHLISKHLTFRNRIQSVRTSPRFLLSMDDLTKIMQASPFCSKCHQEYDVHFVRTSFFCKTATFICPGHPSHNTHLRLSVPSPGQDSNRFHVQNIIGGIFRMIYSPTQVVFDRIFLAFGLQPPPKLPSNVISILADVLKEAHNEERDLQISFLNQFESQHLILDTQWNRPQRQGSRSRNCVSVLLSTTNKAICVYPISEDIPDSNIEISDSCKDLEKIGSSKALRFIAPKLSHIRTVCHDACSTVSSLIRDVILPHHPSCQDCLDTWHFLKKMTGNAKNLEKKFPKLEKLHKYLITLVRKVVQDHQDDLDIRVRKFLFHNWRLNFRPDLSDFEVQEIYNFVREYAKDVRRLVPHGTSIGESYNNHNMCFFTKRIYYPPPQWSIKMYCAYLQWNDVPNWADMVITRVLQRLRDSTYIAK
jgi:hypothetical protein